MPIATGSPFFCNIVFNLSRCKHPPAIPLNLKFSPQRKFIRQTDPDFININRSNLHGPGIYCLCFRKNISQDAEKDIWIPIYIGSFLGEAPNLFSGNVADARWWKHLATVTMRGCDVSIGPHALYRLLTAHGVNPLIKALTAACPRIHVPRNCVSSVNRVTFAIKHWASFRPRPTPAGHGPSKLLNHFKFIYIRFDKASSSPAAALNRTRVKNYIESAERALIDIICPCCNDKKPSISDQSVYDKIVKKLRKKSSYSCKNAGSAIFSAMQIVEQRTNETSDSEEG